MPNDFEPSRLDGDFEDRTGGALERRRAVDPMVEIVLHKLNGMESRIGDRVGLLLEDFRKEIRLELHQEIRNLVPGGDIEGHRKSHESMIESATRWQQFRFGMFEHIAKTVGLAIVVFVAVAVWDSFKKRVGQ